MSVNGAYVRKVVTGEGGHANYASLGIILAYPYVAGLSKISPLLIIHAFHCKSMLD